MTPTELSENPQLASLFILDAALSTTRLALIAAHPELGEEGTLTPDIALVGGIVSLTEALKDIIVAYQGLIERETRSRYEGIVF